MEQVTLRRGGLIEAEGRDVGDDPLPWLGAALALDGDARLRDFFAMLARHPVLVRVSPFLPGLMEQYAEWPGRCPEPLGIEEIVVIKVVELIGFPGPPCLEIYTALTGMCGGEEVELKAHPVKTIVDLPVRLGRLKHRVFGDRLEEMEFTTRHTLFEFIDGMAWQLGFHGTPMECALRR